MAGLCVPYWLMWLIGHIPWGILGIPWPNDRKCAATWRLDLQDMSG